MKLILKAIGRTLLILAIVIFWAIVVMAVTQLGSLGVLAFWVTVFLGILACMIDDAIEARRARESGTLSRRTGRACQNCSAF
jgi:hypothetical protein